jgi:hypothetical protein
MKPRFAKAYEVYQISPSSPMLTLRLRRTVFTNHSSEHMVQPDEANIRRRRIGEDWWAHQDLNLGPLGYEPIALTN